MALIQFYSQEKLYFVVGLMNIVHARNPGK